MRLIHELMFFFPSPSLDAERTKLIQGIGGDKKREFQWGDFLRRKADEVYQSLALKLDQHIMVSPTVMHAQTPVVPEKV